ncbi:hypothetical protein CLV78_104328 [Aliiruegeria haliotis]|uniref:Uncharacterized protein n=1 Tax=Aliiruegeria haliotis TaxID=1280846 RepID=A0A2T0RRK4_9RHOB|nr:hypothetical protein [Aliiruegeria haliotis]PRY23835.1 hypothetical protein CLV78_104328 [Aliiruegeria haliotis]
MLVKIVTFFLIGIAALAMFGRLRWPGAARRRDKGGPRPPKPRKCKACGSYVVGKGPCPCGKG